MFKVWTYSTLCFSVSFVNFEQVNASWEIGFCLWKMSSQKLDTSTQILLSIIITSNSRLMSNECYHYFSVKLLSLGLDVLRNGNAWIYILISLSEEQFITLKLTDPQVDRYQVYVILIPISRQFYIISLILQNSFNLPLVHFSKNLFSRKLQTFHFFLETFIKFCKVLVSV